MKLLKISIVFLFFACNENAYSQIIADEGCSGYRSTFTRINDSVYKVTLHIHSFLLFEGEVINPDTTQPFMSGRRYFANHDYYAYNTSGYNGICRFYNLYSLREEALYAYGRLKSQTLYEDGRKVKKSTYDLKKNTEKYYRKGRPYMSIITRTNSRHTRLTKRMGSKVTKLQYDSVRRDFQPYKRKTIYYFETGEREKVVTLYPSGNIKSELHYGYYGQPVSETQYYRNGKIAFHSAIMQPENTIYQYSPAGQLMLRQTTCNGEVKSEFRKDTIAQRIDFIQDSIKASISWRGDHCEAALNYVDGGSEIRYAIYLKDDIRYFRKWINDTLRLSRYLTKKWGYMYQSKYDLIGSSGNIEEYFEDVLEDMKHIDPQYSEYNINYMQDTVFKNDLPEKIRFRMHDTIYRYVIKDGKPVPEYASHMFRVAKDIAQCSEGIKDHTGNWAVRPSFSEITKTGDDTNILYFAKNENYCSIFDWKALQLVPPVKNLQIIPWEMDRYSMPDWVRDSLHLRYNSFHIINDTASNRFYVMSSDNKILVSVTHPLELAESSYWHFQTSEIPEFSFWDADGREGRVNIFNIKIPSLYEDIHVVPRGYIAQIDSFSYDFYNNAGLKFASERFRTFYRINDTLFMLSDSLARPRIFDFSKGAVIKSRNDITVVEQSMGDHFIAKKDEQYGVLNSDLEAVLPFRFRSLSYNGFTYVATTGDSIYLHDVYSGKILKLSGDSIQPVYYESGSAIAYYFTDNGKMGLLTPGGKLLAKASYDNICKIQGGFYQFLFFRNDSNFHALIYKDSLLFATPRIKDHFYTYASLKDNAGYLDPQYDISIMDIYNRPVIEHVNITERYSGIVPVYRDGLYLGNINSFGQWVFRNTGYKSIQKMTDKWMYATDSAGKTGVIDCAGTLVFPLEHQFLAYVDEHRLLWYNCMDMHPDSIYTAKELRNKWKIKSSTTELQDTFYNPSNFIGDHCVLVNNKGRSGVIGKNLQIVWPFIYTKIYRVGEYYILEHPDGTKQVCDYVFRPLARIDYDGIYALDFGTTLAFKDNRIFLLNDQLRAFDQSDRFFIDRKEMDILSVYSGYSYYEGDRELPDTLAPGVHNFLGIISAFYNRKSRYSSDYAELGTSNPASVYPEPIIQYDPYHDTGEMSDFTVPKPAVKFIYTNTYKPKVFKAGHLAEMGYLTIETASLKTVTLASDRYSGEFHNFYIDSAAIYYLPLEELVSDREVFVATLKKYIATLDDPQIPCITSDDYFEFFRIAFSIGDEGFRFHFSADEYFTIPVREMKTLMTPYWAARF